MPKRAARSQRRSSDTANSLGQRLALLGFAADEGVLGGLPALTVGFVPIILAEIFVQKAEFSNKYTVLEFRRRPGERKQYCVLCSSCGSDAFCQQGVDRSASVSKRSGRAPDLLVGFRSTIAVTSCRDSLTASCTPNFRMMGRPLSDSGRAPFQNTMIMPRAATARFPGLSGGWSVLPEMSIDGEGSGIERGMSLPALCRAGMLRERTARRVMTAPWRRPKFGRQRWGLGVGGG